MDKATKSMLAVGSLVIAIFMGINYMVDKDRGGSWLFFLVLFFGLTIFFWWWMSSDERRVRQDAEKEAREKIRQAEDQLRKARDAKPAIPAAALPKPVVVPTPSPTMAAATTTIDDNPSIVEVPEPVEMTPPVSTPEPTVSYTEATTEPEPIAVVTEVPAPDSQIEPEPETVEVPAPFAIEVQAAAEDKEPIPSIAAQETTPSSLDQDSAAPVGQLPTEEGVVPPPNAPILDPDEPVAVPTFDIPAPAAPANVVPGADDLTRIEGIGPYYRDILHKSGITTFEALSTLSRADIDSLIKTLGARRSNTTGTWAEQAALAAAGDWAGFAALQATLANGRK